MSNWQIGHRPILLIFVLESGKKCRFRACNKNVINYNYFVILIENEC